MSDNNLSEWILIKSGNTFNSCANLAFIIFANKLIVQPIYPNDNANAFVVLSCLDSPNYNNISQSIDISSLLHLNQFWFCMPMHFILM